MLIDFDAHFTSYMGIWLEAHQNKYEHVDQIEAMMPELYSQFCHTQADWLQGISPSEYFSSFKNGDKLVRLMEQYLLEEVSVPDLLLERLENMGFAVEAPLFQLLQDEAALPEARMIAINLLTAINSNLPLQLYISWQLDREEKDDLADVAIDSLENMGNIVIEPILESLHLANENGKEVLLGILSRYPGTPGVYDALIQLFNLQPERQAVLAAYLARFGDERALTLLQERALQEGLSYLDFIELRAAIEALGGEAPERSFEDDPQYEAMSGLM